MNQKKKQIIERAIRKTAERHGISVQEARAKMQFAILRAMQSTEPNVQAFWADYPSTSTVPTPEEVLAFVSDREKRRGFS